MNSSETPAWLDHNEIDMAASGATAPIDDQAADSTNSDKKLEPSSSSCVACSCVAAIIAAVSIIFLALFVYSAIMQTNDIDGVEWIVFYSVNAILPAIFLVYYLFHFPAMALYILSAATAIYSIVYIVITSLRLKTTPDGGREELAYELGGASIALFSSFYHISMTKFCVNKNRNDDE